MLLFIFFDLICPVDKNNRQMQQTSKDRDTKVALSSIKTILYDIQQDDRPDKYKQLPQNSHGELQMMLMQMRIAKLKEVFMQKINRGNLYRKPINFHLKSQEEIDRQRIFKMKGIRFDQRLLSVIYILDILFSLVTFVTGSFGAFIDDFTLSGDYDSKLVIALMIIAIIVTSFKVIACSITKTIEDGIELNYLIDISKNYYQSFFVWIDIAYIGINVASLVNGNNNAGLAVASFIISLLKIFSLYENLRMFETTFINSFKKQQYFNLLKVALFNIFFAHFVASILLAMSKIDDENNWRVKSQINLETWFIQYMWSFYWACTIVMTVGFGDFLPYTFQQAFIVAFIELFSCIVLAYNISEIGNIISAIRSSQTQFRRKIAIFKRMSIQDKIQKDLQRRIEGYLRQETQIKEKFEYGQQNELLAGIPQNLRSEYIVQSNKQIFPDLPFFKNLQKSTLVNLTQNFKGKVYYPGQYMMRIQEANDSIMILKSGVVGLAYKKYGSLLNGVIVQQIKVQKMQVASQQGQFQQRVVPILLNNDFLSLVKRQNYDIIAQNYSFVFHIADQDFFSVLKNSQIDSSYFFSIKHKHSVLSSEWGQLVCEHCTKFQDDSDQDQQSVDQNANKAHSIKQMMKIDKKKYHNKFQCPKLHYFPLTGILLLKNIRHHGFEQNRDQSFFRSRKRPTQCLNLRKDFFKLYQTARNLSFYKKNTSNKVQTEELRRFFENKDKKADQMLANRATIETQKREQVMIIQKVVRQAIEQAMTGYRPEFWEIEIDMLYNYANYFPLENSKNLNLIELGKTKAKRESIPNVRRSIKSKSVLQTLKNYASRDKKEPHQ